MTAKTQTSDYSGMNLSAIQKHIVKLIGSADSISTHEIVPALPVSFVSNLRNVHAIMEEQVDTFKEAFISFVTVKAILVQNSLVTIVNKDSNWGIDIQVFPNNDVNRDIGGELKTLINGNITTLAKTKDLDQFIENDYRLQSEMTLEEQIRSTKESIKWTKIIGVFSIVASTVSLLFSAFTVWLNQKNLSDPAFRQVNIVSYPKDQPPLKVEPLTLDPATLDKLTEAMKAKSVHEVPKTTNPQ